MSKYTTFHAQGDVRMVWSGTHGFLRDPNLSVGQDHTAQCEPINSVV